MKSHEKKPLDNRKLRLILLGSLVASALIFLIIAVYGLSVLNAKSQKIVALKLQSDKADAQLTNLENSKREIEKYAYFKSIAGTVIPNDKDQAEAVLQINQIASAAGISIKSITFPTSSLGASASTTDATTSASTVKAISQATPVSGIPGLYSLALTIEPAAGSQVPTDQQVTYPKLIDFLNRVESNRRTAQIAQINIQPAQNSSGLDFSLTVNIFIKP